MSNQMSKTEFIRAAQVKQLYLHSGLGVIASMIIVLVVFAISWTPERSSFLIGWSSAVAVLSIVRTMLGRVFLTREHPASQIAAWERRFLLLMGITGALWGMAGFYLLPEAPIAYQSFLLLLFGGLVVSAVGLYSVYFPAFAIFAYTLTPSVAVITLAYGEVMHTAVGLFTVVFLGVMTGISRRLHREFEQLHALRFENSSLVDELKSEIEVRKAAEKELLSVKERIEVEVKHLETDLRQAQKMELIGRLAGGVAHDLNNILTGLVSYPDFLLHRMAEDDPMFKPLRIIRQSGQNAAEIVQDLLTLSRRSIASKDIINLNDLIAAYLSSKEIDTLKTIHPKVTVTVEANPELLNVSGSEIHLLKSLMNLVTNAAEAMPAGGQIVIKTDNCYVDASHPAYQTIEEGEYALLSVSDNGIGMSPEIQEHIFEPFYSQKKLGRSGSGLGMAVVWGTVKDHNGAIQVDSEEGEGTTFSLYFPITRDRPSIHPDKDTIDDFISRGESVLVVDDSANQRDLAQKFLSKLGYCVACAASGQEALEMIKRSKQDILLLDMVMEPGMDGLDTYREALQINPTQRAIIVSGFSESNRVREARRLGAGAYVQKPYTLKKLAKAVRMTLDGKQERT